MNRPNEWAYTAPQVLLHENVRFETIISGGGEEQSDYWEFQQSDTEFWIRANIKE
ncbi:hypothetical protein ACFPVX_19460 [Cohnella faecalis]|uniref:hypothetical protein n=1 Tax=Cohnella faecalis TaxID=2315694 RepID=UPI001314FF48|nr:hypothetical protein [Cohnella faecalis]